MPRRGSRRGGKTGCTICQNPQRARLDFLAASGAPIAQLAKRFGVSHWALGRHYKKHCTDEFKKSVLLGPFKSEGELRRLCAESGASVLDSLKAVYSALASRYLTNFEAGADDKVALLAARLHQNLELQAKLTRELMPAATTVTNNFFALP